MFFTDMYTFNNYKQKDSISRFKMHMNKKRTQQLGNLFHSNGKNKSQNTDLSNNAQSRVINKKSAPRDSGDK